jgi:PAS domain S-box-containing protein
MAAGAGLPAALAEFADALPHLVWVTAPDGAVVYASRRAREFAGTAPGEVLGSGWLALVHPDDADRAVAVLQEATATGEPLAAEYRVRRADGVYRWMSARGAPIRGDDGTMRMWVGTLTDIDDQKRLEMELRTAQRNAEESLALIDAVQALAPVGFAFLDTEFRYVRINDSLAETNGAPAANLLGRRVPDVIPWMWPMLGPFYRDVIEKQATFNGIDVSGISGADGQVHHWLASYYPIVVHGDLVGMGVLVLDVTERHHAQRQLEELRALLESSTDCVSLVDTDLRLRYVNKGGRDILGIPYDVDVTGLPGDTLLAPDERERTVREATPVLDAAGRWEGTVRLRHWAGGPDVPVDVSTFYVHDSATGEPVALATVGRDARPRITAANAIEEAHTERQRLLGDLVRAADEERRRIAADVHDDTIQVLAAVDMRLQLLRGRLRDPAAGGDAESAPALVDDVRDLVHDAANRLRGLLFDLEPPSTTRGIATVLELTARQVFEGTGVTVAVTGDVAVEPGGATLSTVYRVAREALSNAFKHAGASRLDITVEGTDRELTVTIDDDGVGPGPATTAPGHLGIVSMRERMELAYGHFELGPRPGGGTRVRLTAPLE